jgi:D-3-phosphoglycerate dehydrogenase
MYDWRTIGQEIPQIVAASGDFTAQIFGRLPVQPRVRLRFADLRSPHDVARETDGADAVIVDDEELNAAHIDALAPSVRIIGRAGTGLDAVDLQAARRRGISVLYLPAFATEEVADHTLALILAALRRLPDCGDVARWAWGEWRRVGRLRSLGEVTVGLVGTGRIGGAVLERLRPFGSRLLAFDPAVATPPDGVELVATLDELLTRSDVVSLHVPLAEATRGMIGGRELALMRPDAVLVNVSRGGLIDEPALVEALRAGRIGGAALDVVAEEPAEAGAPILSAPDAVLTPHVGWFSDASEARARDHTLHGLAAYLRGEDVPFGTLVVDARGQS